MSKQTRRLKVLVGIVNIAVVVTAIMIFATIGLLQWDMISFTEFLLRFILFIILTGILGSFENYLIKHLRKNIRRERKLKVIPK